MNNMHNKRLGSWGEDIAADFLKRHGYAIIEKNYYTRFGEIDIIAREDNVMIFVEVKTRMSLDYGWPEEAIDRRKIRHLFKTADIYMADNRLYEKYDFRFDAISIILDKKNRKAKIRHFENVAEAL